MTASRKEYAAAPPTPERGPGCPGLTATNKAAYAAPAVGTFTNPRTVKYHSGMVSALFDAAFGDAP